MEHMFLAVLNMSLTASYVIAAIILVRLFLKKAPKVLSYILWAVVGFRLVFPFSFESVFSLIPFKSSPIPADIVMQPIPRVDSGIVAIDNTVSRVLPAAAADASVNPLEIWQAAGSYLWLAGMAVMLIYSVVSILLLKRRLRGRILCESNIYEARNLKTPFVLGFLRPKIYIPSGLCAEERSYIILHEQTHIRRFDHVVKLFAFLILCIHWFNPLVWIAFILMAADMEMSCDEWVLKKMGGDIKKAYSASLLSMAMGRHLVSGSPLAFGEGNVKGRIKNVLNFKKPAAWVMAVSIVLVAVLSVGFAANRTGKEGRDPTKADSLDAFAASYSFERSLYMNPLSSYSPFYGTGQLYLLEDKVFSIIDENTGEVSESVSLANWKGKEVDVEEWSTLFEIGKPIDISSYSVRTQYDISDQYHIYQMDSEVWLADLRGGHIWSIYKLKETAVTTMNTAEAPSEESEFTTSWDRKKANGAPDMSAGDSEKWQQRLQADIPGVSTYQVRGVYSSDFDENGISDLMVLLYSAEELSPQSYLCVYMNDDPIYTETFSEMFTVFGFMQYPLWGDIDHDGYPEILYNIFTGGNGGAGSSIKGLLKYEKHELVPMNLPGEDLEEFTENYDVGYQVKVLFGKDKNEYKAVCEGLEKTVDFKAQNAVYEDGTLYRPNIAENEKVGANCRGYSTFSLITRNGKTYLMAEEYLYGEAGISHGVGFATFLIEWDAGGKPFVSEFGVSDME